MWDTLNVNEEDEKSPSGSTLAGEGNDTSGNITIRSDADNQVGQSKLCMILDRKRALCWRCFFCGWCIINLCTLCGILFL